MSSSIYNAVFGSSSSSPQSSSEKRNLSNTSLQDNTPDRQVQPKQAIYDISSPISSRVDIHANQSNDIAKMLEDMHARFNSLDTWFSTYRYVAGGW